MPDNVVEVRCPAGPQRLFTKLRLGQIEHRYIQPGNLIEFACTDCAKVLSRAVGRPLIVLHRFNFAGDLVETTTELKPEPSPQTRPE